LNTSSLHQLHLRSSVNKKPAACLQPNTTHDFMLISENPFVGAQLRNLVYYSLDNELLSTALFHASRLHGLDARNGDAAHLISLCHFRLGQYKAAYDYSRDKGLRGQHLGCSFIFAQSCLSLQRYTEGITALDRSRGLWAVRNHWSESEPTHLPICFGTGY
jgi:anaphase-promoting complex subunit 3